MNISKLFFALALSVGACSGGSGSIADDSSLPHRGPIRPIGGTDALGADLVSVAPLGPEAGSEAPIPARDAGAAAEVQPMVDGGSGSGVEAGSEVLASAPDLRPIGPDVVPAAPDLRPGPDVLTSVPDVLVSVPDLGRRDVQPLGPGSICGEAAECKSGICSKVTGRCCQTTCPNNGCNFGCDTSGMCSACATCTCDGTTGLCHC